MSPGEGSEIELLRALPFAAPMEITMQTINAKLDLRDMRRSTSLVMKVVRFLNVSASRSSNMKVMDSERC